MVYRPDKTIGNEHQKFTTMDKYKAKDVVKPASMQVAELERGSTAYNSAILAVKKQEVNRTAGIETKSTEEILNEIKKQKGGQNVTLSDLENLR